jgi:myosin heavy subunit
MSKEVSYQELEELLYEVCSVCLVKLMIKYQFHYSFITICAPCLYQAYDQLQDSDAKIKQLQHHIIEDQCLNNNCDQTVTMHLHPREQEEFKALISEQKLLKNELIDSRDRVVQLKAEVETREQTHLEITESESKLKDQLSLAQSSIIKFKLQVSTLIRQKEEAVEDKHQEYQDLRLLEFENEKLFYKITDVETMNQDVMVKNKDLVEKNKELDKKLNELQHTLQTSTETLQDGKKMALDLQCRNTELDNLIKKLGDFSEDTNR